MDSNKEIIAKLKELNEKLAKLINSTKETYQMLDSAINKSKKQSKEEVSETSLLAKSANRFLN
ncbi:MAG: hypothetical protein M3421_07990 [Bacteroidota bacterium]|jgi:uncharacterized membrane protein YfbV (UPF0208 family)|nr:hypothetical protein [Bacteroidota bacterium]